MPLRLPTRDRRPNAAKIFLFTSGRKASDFAEFAPFSRTYVYDCLNGRTPPGANFKQRLSELLDIPGEVLYPEDAP